MSAHDYTPGDITVSPFPGGFLIGRLIDGSDGRVWEYIAAATKLQEAWRVACRHAAVDGRTVWTLENGESVPLDCSQFSTGVERQ